MEILENMKSVEGNVKSSCDGCAACCTGGGPILRAADEHLIKTGKIPLKYLYTIREGELLFDKDKVTMVPLGRDNIKIKVNPETLECLFLDHEKKCTIYNTRPSECRAFKCWDSRQIEMIYSSDECLTRKDLLKDVAGLWELVKDHHERCSYEKLGALVEQIDSDNDKVLDEISAMVNYDKSLRETLGQKGNMDPEMVDFLLGRPLTQTIVMFSYKIEEKEGGLALAAV